MLSQFPTRKRIAWITLALLVIAGVTLWKTLPVGSEPILRNKSIGQWFGEVWSHSNEGKPGMTTRFAPHARVDPALQAISEMGSNGVPFLIEKLTQKDHRKGEKGFLAATRAKLPLKLQRYFPEPRTVAQERFIAIRALGQIGPSAQTAVPALTAALSESGLDYAAVYSLGKIGPAAKTAMPELTRLLQHEMDVHTLIGASWRHGRAMRPFLLEALASIGPDAQAAVPILIADIEGHAARINEITNYLPVAEASLSNRMESLRMFEKIEKNNRFLAASALWRIDPTKREVVVSTLLELLEGEEFWNPSVAIGALFRHASHRWAGPKGGRILAARLLGEIGDPKAIPSLSKALKDADEDLMTEAAIALERIQNLHP